MTKCTTDSKLYKPLPQKLHPELHHPAPRRCLDLPEIRIAHRADRIIQIGMVEQIEKLRAELQPLLLGEAEGFERGGVPVDGPGPFHQVAARVSQRTGGHIAVESGG